MVVLDIRDIRSQFAVWAFFDSMQHISSLKANCFSVVIDGTPLIINVFIIPLTGLHSVPGESSLRPSVSPFV
jgi:ABC-type arginine/histidine transport system permease subunit